jgi:2-oxoglutarate dehydrogenase E2 component (dihydrolipoamide succinyltransferase)
MTATTDICAPAEQTEGTRSQVLRWLKQVGDPVQQNEPLVEMETDKVTVEVAAPASGVLQAILKGEQEEISPGDVLGRIALPETSSSSVTAATESQAAESTHQNPPAAPVTTAEAVQSAAAGTPPRTRTRDSARTNLAPAVRRLLAEKGLDPSQVQGTGEGGRITVDDVLAFAAVAGKRSETAEERAARDASAEASSSALPSSQGIPSHYVPHSAVRKRIAEHMVQSLLHTAPHVTTVFEADLAAVSAHRARHKLEFEAKGVPLTFTSYFLAAAVEAIRVVPEANSRWTDSALEIYDAIHIGVATALEGIGLVVPVMRNVDHKDLFGIATALNDVVNAARAGNLQPADLRGGTFTLSNHGVSGSLLAAPIVINQPQSAILGVGKLEKRPVVVTEDGEEHIAIRPRCYVTLTIDHRVMDGHQANRFMHTFVSALEGWPAD